MTKFKKWLVHTYLPAYAKDAMLEENDRLRKRIDSLESENERLQEYISGMHDCMKLSKRIIINTGGNT